MRRGWAEVEERRIWILTRGRQGDFGQMQALAQALGWPTEVKRLAFHRPHVPALANLLLKRESAALEAPWPDLALCAEALPGVIARHLKRKSGGRVRIVCLGRPAGDPKDFDLVLTTAQYRLPEAANIVQLSMPLSNGAKKAPEAPPPGEFVRPLIVLAVGGSSFPDRLDAAAAAEMAKSVSTFAEQRHGTLWAFTSPRTAKDAAAALGEALAAPHRVHLFASEGQNPYRAALAAAEHIVVTSDSVSMVADGLATGKPVQVYRLPQSRGLEWHLTEWLYRHAILKPTAWSASLRWLFHLSLIEVSADRHLLFKALAAERRIGWFGEAPVMPKANLRDDLELALRRVRGLF